MVFPLSQALANPVDLPVARSAQNIKLQYIVIRSAYVLAHEKSRSSPGDILPVGRGERSLTANLSLARSYPLLVMLLLLLSSIRGINVLFLRL